MKSKKCNYKGCTNPVWSGDLCKNHIPKKALKTVSIIDVMRPYARTQAYKTSKNTLKIEMMHEFFITIWNKRLHKSEVSGDSLGNEALSIFFHHILPKEKYSQAALDENNIILLTFDEHQDVESDMYKFEKVNKRRKELFIKYNLI